jgi:hypothetical protein
MIDSLQPYLYPNPQLGFVFILMDLAVTATLKVT